jgi:hypothetical protein
MMLNTRTLYKLKEIQPEHVIITGVASVSTPGKKRGKKETHYNLAGTNHSEFLLERQSGWITEATLNREMQGVVNLIEDHGNHVHETVIHLKMKSETRIRDREETQYDPEEN